MNPNRVRVGQVWRDPDGDQREVLFVESVHPATTCHDCGAVVDTTEPSPAPAPQYGLSLGHLRALCNEAQRRAKPGVRPSLALALSGYRASRRIDLAPGLSGKAIAYECPKGVEPSPNTVTATRVRVFVDDVRRWLRRQEAK